jgi:hypothetical protein
MVHSSCTLSESCTRQSFDASSLLPALLQGAFDSDILKVLHFYKEQRDTILGEVRLGICRASV